jgi:hypothetical protein
MCTKFTVMAERFSVYLCLKGIRFTNPYLRVGRSHVRDSIIVTATKNLTPETVINIEVRTHDVSIKPRSNVPMYLIRICALFGSNLELILK